MTIKTWQERLHPSPCGDSLAQAMQSEIDELRAAYAALELPKETPNPWDKYVAPQIVELTSRVATHKAAHPVQPIDDILAAIEKALVNVHPGEWTMGSFADGVLVVDTENGKHWPIAKTGDWAIPWDSTSNSRKSHNDAAYFVAVQPKNVRALLDRIAAVAQPVQPKETK